MGETSGVAPMGVAQGKREPGLSTQRMRERAVGLMVTTWVPVMRVARALWVASQVAAMVWVPGVRVVGPAMEAVLVVLTTVPMGLPSTEKAKVPGPAVAVMVKGAPATEGSGVARMELVVAAAVTTWVPPKTGWVGEPMLS